MFGTYKSCQDRKKYINNHYKDDKIKSAIWDYVSGYTSSVNDYLRDNHRWLAVTKYLDEAFHSKYCSVGKINVYRTVEEIYLKNIYGITKSNIEKHVGDILTNKGYMSASKKLQSPWGDSWNDSEVILHIVSNKDIQFLDIDKIFANEELPSGEQHEILFNRNTKMKIVGYSLKYEDDPEIPKGNRGRFDINGTLIIQCEIINETNEKLNCNKEYKMKLVEKIYQAINNGIINALNESNNRNLIAAKAKKDDEYYTRDEDILKEFSNYERYFAGKTIYCNCDNPEFSNIYKYFLERYEKFHLKGLYASWLGTTYIDYFNGLEHSKIMLKDNEIGSFTDESCVNILKSVDIVVTNPPFSNSYTTTLMQLCIKNNVDFLFTIYFAGLAKQTLDAFVNQDVHCGYNDVHIYNRPDGTTKRVNTHWVTSLPVEKPYMTLTKSINDINYFDYNDIKVLKTIRDIPYDYEGKIAVPLTILAKLNYKQFDLVGYLKDWNYNEKNQYIRIIIKKRNN